MSYDVYLKDKDGNILTSTTKRQDGGTYVIGGTNECHLNITFNYAEVYNIFNWNVYTSLNGKKAITTMEKMKKIVEKCGINTFKDYWAPTPGNAGYALSILHGWANEHPGGVWEVSK